MCSLCSVSNSQHQQAWLCTHKRGKALNSQSLISQCKPLYILQAGKHSFKIISRAGIISKTTELLATGFLLCFECSVPSTSCKHMQHAWLQLSQALGPKKEFTRCTINRRWACILQPSAFLGEKTHRRYQPFGHTKVGSQYLGLFPTVCPTFLSCSYISRKLGRTQLLPLLQLPKISTSGHQKQIERGYRKKPQLS